MHINICLSHQILLISQKTEESLFGVGESSLFFPLFPASQPVFSNPVLLNHSKDCEVEEMEGTVLSSRSEKTFSLQVFKLCHIHGILVFTVENSAGISFATALYYSHFSEGRAAV